MVSEKEKNKKQVSIKKNNINKLIKQINNLTICVMISIFLIVLLVVILLFIFGLKITGIIFIFIGMFLLLMTFLLFKKIIYTLKYMNVGSEDENEMNNELRYY